jgi:hypothetical protein
MAGQPRKWKTPEDLERDFAAYIDDCKTEGKFPNIAGFCVFCKVHRDTFYSYKADLPEYADTIKKIEETLEEVSIQCGAGAKNPAFMIFYMKNKFGYTDKTEINAKVEQNASINEAELDAKLQKLLSQHLKSQE